LSVISLLLDLSTNVTISDNSFGYEGILIETSPQEPVKNDTLSYWNTHTMENNFAHGKPFFYYANEKDTQIPSDASMLILANCTNFTVIDSYIENVDVGFQIGFCSQIKIINNVFENISIHNIILYASSDNVIKNNSFYNNNEAIHLFQRSSNNEITDNQLYNNEFGIMIEYYSDNNHILDNFINGSLHGVFINDNSNLTTIHLNELQGNTYGLSIGRSSNNNVIFNTFDDNYVGLYLEGDILSGPSINNNISDNTFVNNEQGMRLVHASNNIIKDNNILDSQDIGIFVTAPCLDGNMIYHNNFIGNHEHARDSRFNTPDNWDNNYPIGGNYWQGHDKTDVYKGEDQNIPGGDGICDNQYLLPGNTDNFDRYPLVRPWSRICGNIDGSIDGQINIADVTLIVGYLFNGGLTIKPVCVADVNNDGSVNIADVTYLIGYLFSGGPPPLEYCCTFLN